jgi:hypothetical protein
MSTTLLTLMEERLAADADGSLKRELSETLAAKEALLSATRGELRSPGSQAEHAAALQALAAGQAILTKARVGV